MRLKKALSGTICAVLLAVMPVCVYAGTHNLIGAMPVMVADDGDATSQDDASVSAASQDDASVSAASQDDASVSADSQDDASVSADSPDAQ
jgi:hypothetical protein